MHLSLLIKNLYYALKINAEEDEHSDPLIDLVLTMDRMKLETKDVAIDGYIQAVGVKPLLVLAYTRRQINFLAKLVSVDDAVTLQIDGTGAFFGHLGIPFDTSDGILYTMVRRSATGSTPLPLLEFITTDGTVPSLHNSVFRFFNK